MIGIRPQHAAKADLAPIGGGEDHIGALDAVPFGEDCSGTLPQPHPPRPLLEGLPEDVGQEADQDVRVHPIRALVPDGAETQLALLDAEGRLGIGELDVRLPEGLGRPVRDVDAEDVTALAPRVGLGQDTLAVRGSP